jgi:hypothetical protein
VFTFPVCCVVLGPLFLLIRIDENVALVRKSLKIEVGRRRTELDRAKDEVRALEEQLERYSAGDSPSNAPAQAPRDVRKRAG